MSMFAIDPSAIERALRADGLGLIATRDNQGADPCPSYLDVAAKPG
jgi:hypothetical protein